VTEPAQAQDSEPPPAAEAAKVAEVAEAPQPEPSPEDERKRLEKQLDALKRKESELRRALLLSEKPELAEAIRTIQGHAYSVQRAEEKASHGLSKAEVRRRDAIGKKLSSLNDKRAELDRQIEALETEQRSLGSEELAASANERRQALQQLMVALTTHNAALQAAGVDPQDVVPELARLLPEVEAFAHSVSAQAG
jgi:chromosome segregation ATPase